MFLYSTKWVPKPFHNSARSVVTKSFQNSGVRSNTSILTSLHLHYVIINCRIFDMAHGVMSKPLLSKSKFAREERYTDIMIT